MNPSTLGCLRVPSPGDFEQPVLEDMALTIPSTPRSVPPCLCASSVPKGWFARSRGEAPGCTGTAQPSMGEPSPMSHQRWDHLQGQLTSSVSCFPNQQTRLGTEPGPRAGPTVPNCSGMLQDITQGPDSSRDSPSWPWLEDQNKASLQQQATSLSLPKVDVPRTEHVPSSTLSRIRHQQQLNFPGSSRLWCPTACAARASQPELGGRELQGTGRWSCSG